MKWLFVPWIRRISQEYVFCEELGEKGILNQRKHGTPLIQLVSVLPHFRSGSKQTLARTVTATLQSENADFACRKFSAGEYQCWVKPQIMWFKACFPQCYRIDLTLEHAPNTGGIPMYLGNGKWQNSHVLRMDQYWKGRDPWNQNLSITAAFPLN